MYFYTNIGYYKNCSKQTLAYKKKSVCHLLLTLPRVLNFCCQTKVPDLHFYIIIDKEISKFQIPVDDSPIVKVQDTFQDLFHEVSHLRLRQGLSPSANRT